MVEMPKPLEYCLGHILGTCPNCLYDPIGNPRCPGYRPGNMYCLDVEEMIKSINENATRTGLEEEL